MNEQHVERSPVPVACKEVVSHMGGEVNAESDRDHLRFNMVQAIVIDNWWSFLGCMYIVTLTIEEEQ